MRVDQTTRVLAVPGDELQDDAPLARLSKKTS